MSSASQHFTRNMLNGAYHKNFFRDEARVHETISTRNGITSSTSAPKANLTTNFGSLLSAALNKSKLT